MSSSAPDTVPYLVDRLSKPPFSRRLTNLQLAGDASDALNFFQLVALFHDTILLIDQQNPFSLHRQVNVRAEEMEETAERVLEFMRSMRYRPLRAPSSTSIGAV
jgi:hypothetical protein